MSILSKSLITLTGLGVAAALAIGASAQAAQLKSAAAPAPGDCKQSLSVAMGLNPAMAQTIWQQTVLAQYGANWAHWVGAKNKVIIPHGSGAGAQYEARGFPCFYHAVP